MTLAIDLACALDPVAFASMLGLEPDVWQTNVLRSSSRRLLLNCCRQSGKSTTAAILALHTALYTPGALVLLVSPSLRQSGELFRKLADLLHRLEPPPDMLDDLKLSAVFRNGSRILSLPGSEGTIRGFSGVSLIVEDEAARVDDALYAAVRPMLAVSNGRLVLMSTPWGRRGHFHAAWEMADLWESYRVPAQDCPRISSAFLAEERRALSALAFQSEYECIFTDNELSVFSAEHIQAAMDATLEPLSVTTSFWTT